MLRLPIGPRCVTKARSSGPVMTAQTPVESAGTLCIVKPTLRAWSLIMWPKESGPTPEKRLQELDVARPLKCVAVFRPLATTARV